MRLLELFRSVFLSIRARKMRTFLTTLGVIVGSLTIIVVVGIGKGGEQQVANQFSAISADTINIRQNRSYTASKTLGIAQMADLAALENVRAAGMSVTTSSDVSYGSNTETAMIMGISESMVEVNNYKLMAGEFFTDEQGSDRKKLVVIGYALAEKLFGEGAQEQAVGKDVKINSRKYTVVGVLEYKGDTTDFGSGVDDSVLTPYNTATNFLIGRMAMTSITVKASSAKVVAAAKTAISDYIAAYTGVDDAYNVTDQGTILNTAMESATTMASLLIAVAIVVLIVGGIGIMNVLLVAVQERTLEIGILKSIGARRSDILKDFLIEAVLVSLAGGGLGVLLSYAAIPIVNLTGTTIVYSLEGVLLGLLFSFITGVFFGVYPAVKASKLKPIEALNYDG